MLDDPMLLAELIAAKRDQQDLEWRAALDRDGGRITPLSVDRASFGLPPMDARDWHTAYHGGPFEGCPAPVCSGEVLG